MSSAERGRPARPAPPVFVIGSGRTGSTVLSRLLRAHPDVLSISELLSTVAPRALVTTPVSGAVFWRLLAEPHPLFTKVLRTGVSLPEMCYPPQGGRFSVRAGDIPALSLTVLPHLTEHPDALFDVLAREVPRWPTAPAARQYHRLFDLLRRHQGGRVVVERSGNSSRWLPWIRAVFPDAKLVHLYRDGPDCAESMSRHASFRLTALLEDAAASAGLAWFGALTARHVTEVDPGHRWLFDDAFELDRLMGAPIPPARFGAMWSEAVCAAQRCLAGLPAGQGTTLRYEDLVADPARELTRLAAFAGIDVPPDWLDQARLLLEPGWAGGAQQLPPEQRRALDAACAPGVRALAGTRPPG